MARFYSKNEIIELLKAKACELNRLPQADDFEKEVAGNILGYFKKWDKALKTSRLTKEMFIKAKKEEAVPTEAPAECKTCCKKTAEKPAETQPVEEVKEEKTAPTKAASACVKKYSKEMIAELLLAEYNRLGKKPTKKEIDENKDLPSSSTCLKYFETTRLGDMWKEILG